MKAKTILTAIAIAIALSPSWADANFYFSPDDSIKEIITKLQAAMESTIRTAGNESRATLTHGYQLSVAMIDNLETTYADSMEMTFDKLGAERQKTFLEADNLIHSLRKSVPLDEIQRSVDTAREVISEAVPFSNAPIVIDYSPSFVSPRKEDDLLVTIWGSRLHGDGYLRHQLIVNGHEVGANMTQSGSLSFVVPRELLPLNTTATSFLPATLRIVQEPGSILPWAEDDQTEFNLLFTILPQKLGTIEVRKVIELHDREVQKFVSTKVVAERNGGGTDAQSKCEYPPEGFRFDLSTLEKFKDLHTAYKDKDTSPGTNVGGVYITMETPVQICMNVIASTGCTECGGRTEGHFEVDMYRPTTRREVREESPLDIVWGEDMPIDLDQNAFSQTAIIRLFDDIGRAVSLTRNADLPFVSVEPDLDNQVVFIRPDRPWQ